MKVKDLFKHLLTEMTQKELDEKKQQLESELNEIRSEYQSAENKDRGRILSKMQAVKTKLNSLKMMRPIEDKVRTGDDEAKKDEILRRRKMHIYKSFENQERRKA